MNNVICKNHNTRYKIYSVCQYTQWYEHIFVPGLPANEHVTFNLAQL